MHHGRFSNGLANSCNFPFHPLAYMASPQTYDSTAFKQELSGQHIDKKLRSLFMQAPAAIALLEGPEHVYTFANPLYQKLFSRTEGELIGKSVRQVFSEIEGQGVYELFHRVF